MKKEKSRRRIIQKIIVGALRETIRVHGPIRPLLIGSAAKRIAGTILALEEKHEDSITDDSQV